VYKNLPCTSDVRASRGAVFVWLGRWGAASGFGSRYLTSA